MDNGTYERMKRDGCTPEDVYHAARAAGESRLGAMKILHDLFQLDGRATKEVVLRAEDVMHSIDEHEQQIFELLAEVLAKRESTP